MNGAREETENNNNNSSKHNNSKYLFLYDNDIMKNGRTHRTHCTCCWERERKLKLLLVLPFEQKESVFLPKRRMLLFWATVTYSSQKLMENFTLTQPNRLTHTHTFTLKSAFSCWECGSTRKAHTHRSKL